MVQTIVLRSKRIALNHNIRNVDNVEAIRLFVASVVDSVGDSALNGLREDLLDLLGHDGGVTTILSVCLGGALVSLALSGVYLGMIVSQAPVWTLINTYGVGKSLLETRGCGLLDLAGDSRVTGGVRLALSVLVGGRHSDGVAVDGC